MKTIVILGCSNGVGISRDLELMRDVLRNAGYDAEAAHPFRYTRPKRVDLQIHLERFNNELFGLATKNVLVPNQEWFEPEWMRFLPVFDAIFAKTRFAEEIFKPIAKSTHYISYTSQDRYLPDVKKSEYHFVHVAGKSVQKQTDVVLNTWRRNGGFPQLTIVHDPKFYKPQICPQNVNYVWDHMPDHLLQTLQNTCSVHICPSFTEGFGHYIAEAMSCKSVVIATDGPPMTELITPDRGLLVSAVRTEPMRLSTKYIVTEETLEAAVVKSLIMDPAARHTVTENARKFFLENDAAFRHVLLEAVQKVLAEG